MTLSILSAHLLTTSGTSRRRMDSFSLKKHRWLMPHTCFVEIHTCTHSERQRICGLLTGKAILQIGCLTDSLGGFSTISLKRKSQQTLRSSTPCAVKRRCFWEPLAKFHQADGHFAR